jgi:hypothetical protein
MKMGSGNEDIKQALYTEISHRLTVRNPQAQLLCYHINIKTERRSAGSLLKMAPRQSTFELRKTSTCSDQSRTA